MRRVLSPGPSVGTRDARRLHSNYRSLSCWQNRLAPNRSETANERSHEKRRNAPHSKRWRELYGPLEPGEAFGVRRIPPLLVESTCATERAAVHRTHACPQRSSDSPYVVSYNED